MHPGVELDIRTQVEPVGAPAARNLHERVRPEEGGKQHALPGRVQVQIEGNKRQSDGEGKPVEIIDERGHEQQPHDQPAARVSDCGRIAGERI